MDEIKANGELNEHNNDMFTEEISISVTYCVCLNQ